MRVKSLSLVLAVFACAAQALAQGGSPAPPQSGAPSAGAAGGSSLDGMGVKKYLLGPGDVLDLRVFNEPQFNGPLVVNDEGKVEVPFIEHPVPALCRTDREIKQDIVEALSKFLNKPQVSLRVAEMKSRPPAVVFGAVRSPTRVLMQRRARLLELLAQSGGVTEAAGGDIQIFHTEPVMCPEPEVDVAKPINSYAPADPTEVSYDVYSLTALKDGKNEANPYIRPGDIVIVQEAQPVFITGAVMAPQGLYLRESTRMLTQAIAQVGGLRKEAKGSGVVIFRRKPGSDQAEPLRVNLSDIRSGKAKDIPLQPYDIVEVPDNTGGVKGVLKGVLLGGGIGAMTGTFANLPLRVLY
ncbi:MAG TPA: polysaccharide biosynthesis/export family protein [Pyrinomonadaceae bacterium]|nr:polysaccharide biosynthesis/export family protein [Pyrinomonadaceae bacterium]